MRLGRFLRSPDCIHEVPPTKRLREVGPGRLSLCFCLYTKAWSAAPSGGILPRQRQPVQPPGGTRDVFQEQEGVGPGDCEAAEFRWAAVTCKQELRPGVRAEAKRGHFEFRRTTQIAGWFSGSWSSCWSFSRQLEHFSSVRHSWQNGSMQPAHGSRYAGQ